MNTPERAGQALARDMIALAESHHSKSDHRLLFMNALSGAFTEAEACIYDKDINLGLERHNAFYREFYPYMRPLLEQTKAFTPKVRRELLDSNQKQIDTYCT